MRIKHKGLRRLYERNDARSLRATHLTRIRRILMHRDPIRGSFAQPGTRPQRSLSRRCPAP